MLNKKVSKVSISDIVAQQRVDGSKNIKNLHKELKVFFHISEYKLIKGLVEGLEATLKLEYMLFLEESKKQDTVKLYDFWAYDKIIAIYKKSI